METVFTNEIPVSKREFDSYLFEKLRPEASGYVDGFTGLVKEMEKLFSGKKSLHIRSKDFFLNLRANVVLPDFGKFRMLRKQDFSEFDIDGYLANFNFLPGHRAMVPALEVLKINRELLLKEAGGGKYFACVCHGEGEDEKGHLAVYDAGEDAAIDDPDGVVSLFPVCELKISSAQELLEDYLVKYGLFPEELSDEAFLRLGDLSALFASGMAPDFDGDSILNELLKSPDNPVFRQLHWNLTGTVKEYYRTRRVEDDHMDRKEELLQCEKIRADIEPYEERILTDPNRGHWDLWKGSVDGAYTVEMQDDFVARNPLCDINENGVIAIDFGTKSTIVVYQSDIEHSLPMGIGDGNLSKAPTLKRYENPTIMHFLDLEQFFRDYKSKAGRPNTKWSDLTISHTALEQFAQSKSEEYYEYLHQIKKWAGQREAQFRIRSHGGDTIMLPAFRNLEEGDFNPVEIYAYYIGLYINNMRHGIYLDYYLSFPVSYEMDVRAKIVRCFERGLKKSLPEAIVKNPEVMAHFHVNGEISEPVAYAVCALQEYGFAPEEDEEVFYGIFDFGGGTTDFDFGLWRKSAKRRYDYAIENFGAGGDEYLGGENLLEMLAFEVFKANQELMRTKNCAFALAPRCTEFLGSDALLSDSQEAEKNMRNLSEVLRPYWETPEEAPKGEKEGTDALQLIVTLYDRDGKEHADEKLRYSRKKLNQFIERRIRDGISNFFSALMMAYADERIKKPATVNILLAGNSCRSPIVERVFEEEIERRTKDAAGNGIQFEIFPPLGTKAAYQKMKEWGIPYQEDDFERPTGKTGVAFGLIQCREGGTIERIPNAEAEKEVSFRYYLGWQSRKKFVVFEDGTKPMRYRGKPDYGVWYRFIEADAPVFDLYYTTLPECVDGNLLIEGNAAVRRHRCRLDVMDEEAFVYLRAVDSHTIEYVVAKDEDVDFSKLGKIIRKELG